MKKTVKFSFERRTAFCFFIIVLLLFVCFLRIFSIILSPKYKVTASEGHHYILDAGNLRGTIFDRNMHPITNEGEKTMAAVLPTPRTLAALRGVLSDEEMLEAMAHLSCDMAAESMAYAVLSDRVVWTRDLRDVPGLEDSVTGAITDIQLLGMRDAMKKAADSHKQK